MELGFFHPERGYWQAIGGDPEDLLPAYPEGTVQVPLKPGADYEWQDGAWVYVEPAPAPDPVPEEISTKQFFMGLEIAGKITKAEAIDAVLHKIMPPPVQAIIDGMADPDDRYTATMHLMGSNNLHRDHPLVLPFAITQGMTEQDVDDFWRLCAAL